MLDPLTAIGLVGNIVQFIDFGCKIVSKTTETYRAADGSLKENTDLEIVTNDLISINAILTTSGAVAAADPSLDRLCTGCVEVATELLVALEKLKAGKDPTKWRSVRKALRSIWSKDKISGLEARLGGFRDEVNLRIVVSLRGQIEALILQQSDRFDTLDDRSKIVVDAIRSSQDFFTASLQTQTQSLKAIVEESELRLRDDQATARDEVIAAVDDTVQISQLEHQATREEIAQIKLALQQLSEQIERKNDELRDVLSRFSAATTTQKKQKFQDLSRAISLTLLALETVYRSLKTLMANIQSRSMVFLSQSTVRQLWGVRPSPNQTGATKSAPVGSCLELATNPTTVVEYAIMRYYAYYYFPYFADGATYSYYHGIGWINPKTHTKWPTPANVPATSLSNRIGSVTYHQQALELLDLVLSGSSAGSNSSKAYAFVWLMAIINSVPEELFPACGGRYLLFETAFSPLNNNQSPWILQHKDTDGGSNSLHARLQQDLEVWKAIAGLTGLSVAFRDSWETHDTDGQYQLLYAGEDYPLEGAEACTPIFKLKATEIDELFQFILWLITGSHQKRESLQDEGGLMANASLLEDRYQYCFTKGRTVASLYSEDWGQHVPTPLSDKRDLRRTEASLYAKNSVQHLFDKRERQGSMYAKHASTYRVATFFQTAGIVMDIFRRSTGVELIKNDKISMPNVWHYGKSEPGSFGRHIWFPHMLPK